MSQELKAKVDWEPSAKIFSLRKRAEILSKIRQFFAERQVLEVETALLSRFTVTDVHIQSVNVCINHEHYYLQTSPEYAMKRLLASGSGDIFQMSKSFRLEEEGRFHNPEFTLLEWYRLDFDHFQLMQEIEELLMVIADFPTIKRISYQQLFKDFFSIDIFTCDIETLRNCLCEHGVDIQNPAELSKDECLQLLMSHIIEPHLDFFEPVFVYDFPSSQAALARICPKNPLIAQRFELYIKGVEIANGFHELNTVNEQLLRFEQDQFSRRKKGLEVPEIDFRFIAALDQGLPDCSGVALGLDRLMMVLTDAKHINEVISFPWERA